MTIVFQGHVEKVELFGANIDVHVVTPMAECGQVVVLHVPRGEAAHWLPGALVQFTIYAMPPATPSTDKGVTNG